VRCVSDGRDRPSYRKGPLRFRLGRQLRGRVPPIELYCILDGTASLNLRKDCQLDSANSTFCPLGSTPRSFGQGPPQVWRRL
jgi:hypothetical protein